MSLNLNDTPKISPVETVERRLALALEEKKALQILIEERSKELFLEQQKLQKSTVFLENVVEALTSATVVTDVTLKVIRVNEAATKILGHTRASMMGAEISAIFPGDWLPFVLSPKGYEAVSGLYREGVYKRPDGSVVPLGFTISVIRGENGAFSGLVCTGLDITKRKALEQELVQSQKLESVGRLAAGIAHEINTPMQYIRDNTVFLKDQFAPLAEILRDVSALLKGNTSIDVGSSKRKEIIQKMEAADLEYLLDDVPSALSQSLEGAEHVARIVRSMKEFSHPGTEEKVGFNLNKGLESTSIVSKNEWKYVAELKLDLDPKLPEVPCYPGELNQVFLNLIVNAAHAVTDANELLRRPKGLITVRSRAENGQVRISVEDNGTGIPEHVRSRIFDPFFTTKGVGKGTGQGLAIAYSVVVDRHKGTLDFETELGKGTTFHITLPIPG